MERYVRVNQRLGLGARVVLLTRRPQEFAAAAPAIVSDTSVTLLGRDVRELTPADGPFTHAVHGAASADAAWNRSDPGEALDILTRGTERVLAACGPTACGRVLLLSSGAVYAQPARSGEPVTEDMPLGPLWPQETSAYHAGKRLAERAAMAWADETGRSLTVARLFAFVGPGLPLKGHFAIGNFLSDALRGRNVVVRGTGEAVRSYLYAEDMAAWLWTMLLDDRAGARVCNVGSERGLALADVARVVAAAVDPPVGVSILGKPVPGGGGDWYVPSTRRAREELGLSEWTSLEEAVRRTLEWNWAER
jgi:dTDP-glucose 4,6-dehydratase